MVEVLYNGGVVLLTVENGKVVIHAVHERNAKEFWKRMELEDVEKCVVCGAEVTWKNFGAVGVLAGNVRVVCEKGLCFAMFNDLVNKRGRRG